MLIKMESEEYDELQKVLKMGTRFILSALAFAILFGLWMAKII